MTFFRFGFSIFSGLVVGFIVNMLIIYLGMSIIPIPDGMDVNSSESISAYFHLLKPKHFIFPFLAHSFMTLTGTLVSWKLAPLKQHRTVIILGLIFFILGVSNLFMIPHPIWFAVVDLIFAYLPMTYLGILLAKRF